MDTRPWDIRKDLGRGSPNGAVGTSDPLTIGHTVEAQLVVGQRRSMPVLLIVA